MPLARRIVALVTLGLLLAMPAAAADREAALRALAARLDLPLLDRSITSFTTELRRVLPSTVVDAVGRSTQAGAAWKRGQPDFDQAARWVESAFVAEERRAGPLVTIERQDLLSTVRLPWTDDDVAFVDSIADTPLGREAQRALDAKAAEQATATFARELAARPGMESAARAVAPAFAAIDAEARSQFADASLMLVALRGADPARASRLQKLVQAVEPAPATAIGRAVTERLSQRAFDAASAQLPALLAILAGFGVQGR